MRRTGSMASGILVLGLLGSLFTLPPAQAAPVDAGGSIPTTLVSGTQPGALLEGPATTALPTFSDSRPCSVRSFSVTLSDNTTRTATGCAVGSDEISAYGGFVKVGGSDYFIKGSLGTVLPVPNGWIEYHCPGALIGCVLGTASSPTVTSVPIFPGGPTVPTLQFKGFAPFRYPDGALLAVSTDSIAVSDNGNWLAVKTRGRDSLARIDRRSGDVLPFSGATPCCQGYLDKTPLAIDDSGQFVAQGRIDWGSSPLTIWDMAPCSVPPAGANMATGCTSVNVTTLTSTPSFSPSRAVYLRWLGDRLAFAAGDPGSRFANWQIVPNRSPDRPTLEVFSSEPTIGDQVTLLAKHMGAPGSPVKFRVTDGPNKQFAAVVAADAAGAAATFYRGRDLGTDVVVAWVDSNSNGAVDGAEAAAEAQVRWKGIAGYVSLGDSYSAGEGAVDADGDADFDPQTASPGVNQCHRSGNAYPVKLAASLGSESAVMAACSGAILAELIESLPAGFKGQWGEGAQLDRLSRDRGTDVPIDLVTLGIGGNDANFERVLKVCVSGFGNGNSDRGCEAGAYAEYSKGLELLLEGGTITVQSDGTWHWCTAECDGAADVVVPRYRDILADIGRRASTAQLVVVGYPRLFPTIPPASCTVGANRLGAYSLSAKKMQTLNTLGDLLNDTISGIVKQAAEDGVKVAFADPRSAFAAGHSVCDTEDPWVNGLVFDSLRISPFSFHPNAAGQAALAEVVKARWLQMQVV